mmetsp:Transcript_8739/g.17012  ORF Transcript_8739/g.17012 Transcript_8739/m.17012 type:complete len:230 (+) Transcript_8739:2091-2780(+)
MNSSNFSFVMVLRKVSFIFKFSLKDFLRAQRAFFSEAHVSFISLRSSPTVVWSVIPGAASCILIGPFLHEGCQMLRPSIICSSGISMPFTSSSRASTLRSRLEPAIDNEEKPRLKLTWFLASRSAVLSFRMRGMSKSSNMPRWLPTTQPLSLVRIRFRSTRSWREIPVSWSCPTRISTGWRVELVTMHISPVGMALTIPWSRLSFIRVGGNTSFCFRRPPPSTLSTRTV